MTENEYCNLRCCVVQCTNHKSRVKKGIPLFSIPSSRDLRERWLRALKVDNISAINESTRVCVLHFNHDDYFKHNTCHKLKPDRVPKKARTALQELDTNVCVMSDLRLRTSDAQPGMSDIQLETSDAQPRMFVGQPEALRSQPGRSEPQPGMSQPQPGTSQSQPVTSKKQSLRLLPGRQQIRRKFRIQMSGLPRFAIENFMNNDKKILYFTGIQNFKILRIIYRFVFKSEKGPSGAVHRLGKSDNARRKHLLSPLNEFFLTLMKLRKGFEYETLAEMFDISSTAACRIFHSWINLLYAKLASVPIFPHRNVLLENAAQSFLEKYPNVVGSIDCTEFVIEKPSSLVRHSQCFSHYKGTTTLKALIMIEPNGGLVFISSLYTGSMSDKKILEESRFLEVLAEKVKNGSLHHGDIILADKGFNVKDILENVGIELNIPTFKISGMQMAPDDVEYIRKIAHERIHVERAIRRIKAFQILSKRIPISMLGIFNQVYTVCCLLTNFRMPLRVIE